MNGRGCIDQIFSLRMLSEKFLAKNQKLFCAFIDLEKAYDRVNREKLWEILEEYGVNGQLINAIASLYEGSAACVRINGDLTPWFSIIKGVKQGCVMSPWLFILYMDKCMQVLKGLNLGVTMSDTKVCSLVYADDVVLVTENAYDLQRLVSKMNEECQKSDMKMNVTKSNVMVFERDVNVTICKIKVDDKYLEQVNEFVYLGSLLKM